MVWAIVFFALFTTLNLRGIEASARTNTVLAGAMGVVIVVFFAAAISYIFGHASQVQSLTVPFYNPSSWSGGAVLAGTSIAVLTYIGFDGISTLSEEAENPRRNILLATVLACLVIGILSAIQVYAAQLIWSTSTEAYPAGRDRLRPRRPARVGAAVHHHHLHVDRRQQRLGHRCPAGRRPPAVRDGPQRRPATPVLRLRRPAPAHPAQQRPAGRSGRAAGRVRAGGRGQGGFSGGYQLGAELLNFGALIAFMGVNLAAFVRYFIREGKRTVGNLIPPLAGFAICFLLWLNLSWMAKIWGAVWLAGRAGVRRLEDARVPQQPGELRLPD